MFDLIYRLVIYKCKLIRVWWMLAQKYGNDLLDRKIKRWQACAPVLLVFSTFFGMMPFMLVTNDKYSGPHTCVCAMLVRTYGRQLANVHYRCTRNQTVCCRWTFCYCLPFFNLFVFRTHEFDIGHIDFGVMRYATLAMYERKYQVSSWLSSRKSQHPD